MNTTSGAGLATELAFAFARFGPALRKWMTAGVTATTFPRLRLLHVLADGPQIMSALSEQLDVTGRNITVLVDGLEAEGLARRCPHPDDRRATLVELTDAGRGMGTQAFEAHIERVAELFETLTPDEQAELLRLISKLTDHLVELGVTGSCAEPARRT